jgi:hypothetical protein
MTDNFDTWFENSVLLERIALVTGKTRKELIDELEIREKFLQELVEKGIRDQKEVAEMILEYYTDQKEEPKPHRSEKKKQRKKEGRTSIIEERKEEDDILHPLASEEIDKQFQEIMQHETPEQDTILNPLSEGET